MFFRDILQINKFEGADFKSDNSFFSDILGHKYLNKAFLVPNLASFVSSQNFALRQIRISNMTILFSNSSRKTHKSGIFGPRFKDFYFCTKLCNKTNSKMLISNMTIIFSNSSSKIRKSDIFGPKFKNFFFLHKTLQQGKFEGADLKNNTDCSKLLAKTPK